MRIIAFGCEDVAEKSVFVGDERGFEGCLGGLGVFERDWGHRWYCSFFHVQIVLLCDVNVTSEELGSLSVRSMEVYDGGVVLRMSIEIWEQEAEHMILEPTKYILLLEKTLNGKGREQSYPSPTE